MGGRFPLPPMWLPETSLKTKEDIMLGWDGLGASPPDKGTMAWIQSGSFTKIGGWRNSKRITVNWAFFGKINQAQWQQLCIGFSIHHADVEVLLRLSFYFNCIFKNCAILFAWKRIWSSYNHRIGITSGFRTLVLRRNLLKHVYIWATFFDISLFQIQTIF